MNQIDLHGRIAVITGGAQGIGRAIAERMLRSGARVVLWDREAGRLADASAAMSTRGPVDTQTVELMKAHIDLMLSRIPMGRFLQLDEAAAMVCWLASEECSFSTGAVFDLSGGRATY
jgi:2-dehydro-3-deoxy-L-rhamnonate dehydrogenase (NAD+)